MELGARVNDFFYIESKTKKNGGRGGGAGGVNGPTEDQTNYLPLQLFRSWGHNNAQMYK